MRAFVLLVSQEGVVWKYLSFMTPHYTYSDARLLSFLTIHAFASLALALAG